MKPSLFALDVAAAWYCASVMVTQLLLLELIEPVTRVRQLSEVPELVLLARKVDRADELDALPCSYQLPLIRRSNLRSESLLIWNTRLLARSQLEPPCWNTTVLPRS